MEKIVKYIQQRDYLILLSYILFSLFLLGIYLAFVYLGDVYRMNKIDNMYIPASNRMLYAHADEIGDYYIIVTRRDLSDLLDVKLAFSIWSFVSIPLFAFLVYKWAKYRSKLISLSVVKKAWYDYLMEWKPSFPDNK